MGRYILWRLSLVIPTLFGIMLINFMIVQAAPGGPVEKTISRIKGAELGATVKITGGGSEVSEYSSQLTTDISDKYRGSRGLDEDLIKDIEKLYGFDKPASTRFFLMLKNYLTFNFGESFYRQQSVISLILEKLPVSISLGIWSTLIIYLVSIPLGIKKALRDGSIFDVWTSGIIVVGYAVPGFLFAILLIILFSAGGVAEIFPLRGLLSDNWQELGFFALIIDYLWHITLPILAITIGGFASLTMLVKNSFLDEFRKQYVITAKAKGLSEMKTLYRHVFRNAMLIVIAGFPGALIGILFTSSLLIEIIFSLDGLGLLGFEAALSRDYPVLFGSLYIYTLLGLLVKLVSDLTYVAIDPRIDFEHRRT